MQITTQVFQQGIFNASIDRMSEDKTVILKTYFEYLQPKTPQILHIRNIILCEIIRQPQLTQNI